MNGAGKGEVLTIFAEESSKAFAADSKLTGVVCRDRGLPSDIAKAAYDAGRRLLARGEIDEHGFSKVAGGLAAIAKVDIETARYQEGEPANTLNVKQQVAVVHQKTAAEIIAEDMAKIESSYRPAVAAVGMHGAKGSHDSHENHGESNGNSNGKTL